MTLSKNVSLTEHYSEFIDAGIRAGRYKNASEAVRAGLRLLEQQEQEAEARLQWLRDTTQEAFAALDRGEGVRLNSGSDIDAFMDGVLESRRVSADA
jgi:antitoxin ParD1/3/4